MVEQTPKEAYLEGLTDVGRLLDMLREETWRHAEYATKETVNWGHAAELASVRRRLIEALAQLAQQDGAFIEERLAGLRAEGKRQ